MAKVLIFSGAGLSAESGVRTFRDSEGLWEEYPVMEICSAEGYARDPEKVLKFYDMRRQDIKDKHPNAAHQMIARLKERYKDEVAVITQNVDDLLERAGCKDVIHVHGTLTNARCETCHHVFSIGYESTQGKICPKCGSRAIRHNVVMFQEQAPLYSYLDRMAREVEMLVVIGTSGQVVNVTWMAKWARHSILNNKDHDDYMDDCFDEALIMPATEAASRIEAKVDSYFRGELA